MPDKILPNDTQLSKSGPETHGQTIVEENPAQAPAKTTENKIKSTDSKQETETITFSENARNFCEFTHAYLRQYIELADQKAAFLFAIVSAISGYVITSKASPFAIPINCNLPLNWVHISGKASLLLFLISAIACIWVVLPRLKQNDKPGPIFWGEIVAVNSADEYAKMVGNNKDQATSYGVAMHVHTLAVICNRKYFWLKMAMYAALVGLILFAFYLWPILPTIAGGATQ